MFQITSEIKTHLLILALVAGLLPFLKPRAPSLWDIDRETTMREASREMLETDNWVVPTFGPRIARVDKPALLLLAANGGLQGVQYRRICRSPPLGVCHMMSVFCRLRGMESQKCSGPMEELLAVLILASFSCLPPRSLCRSGRSIEPVHHCADVSLLVRF